MGCVFSWSGAKPGTVKPFAPHAPKLAQSSVTTLTMSDGKIIAAAERHVMKYEFIDQETLTLKDDVLEQHNLCVQQYESSSGQKHIDLHLAEEGLCIAFFAQMPVGVGCVHTSDISSVEGLSEAALECIIQILQFTAANNSLPFWGAE